MKRRILLVDDNEDHLDSTKDVLEEEGYEVVTACSGEEAVQEARNQVFHIVLMDIKMPGMNGVEAFIEIKKYLPGVKVIMCTAYIVEDLIREALEEGAYAVLNKPFSMDLLLRSIDNALLQSAHGGSILLADQDEKLCEDLNQLLTAHGYQVVVVHDGIAALKVAEAYAFDIVLVEDDLPRMNGLELHRRIMAGQDGVLATIVLTSGRELSFEERRRIPREEGLTVLAKPLDKWQLLELVESICAADWL